MSIQSEITRISGNISDSLDAVAAKGVTVPSGANSDDLPALIASISGGSTDIFWATYDTTTSAEIEAAYQAGKICAVIYSDRVYYLTARDSSTEHTFMANKLAYLYRIQCVSDVWSTSSKLVVSASSTTPSPLGTAAVGTATTYARADHVHAMPTAADVGAAPAITEVTVTDTGSVSQTLDAGKLYHFTGALTALTITLNTASGVPAQYHFDFDCGSTAPTVTLPNTVTMPDSHMFEASKHYEVDILNNYGVAISWATS